jgi:hypothetical protein
MRAMLLLAFVLSGCADPFEDTKKLDTIEAWESFLTTAPSGSRKLFAEDRLEELLTAQAEKTNLPADYDKVLQKFPNSRNTKKLQEARVKAALAIAEKENTPEAWQTFDAENPFADPMAKRTAQQRIQMAEYKDKLGFSEPVAKQVNLAEDPKGPLNGWGFFCDVTNNGDKRISRLTVEVQLLGDTDQVLRAFQYPVVAGSLPGNMPVPEGFDTPMEPGSTRPWSYTTDEIPEGWTTPKVKMVPVFIQFAPA